MTPEEKARAVIDDKLCIMRACANIYTHINTPQLSAVLFIAIKIYIPRITRSFVIFGIIRIPLNNKFIFTVVIHIRSGDSTHGIGVSFARRSCTALRSVYKGILIRL